MCYQYLDTHSLSPIKTNLTDRNPHNIRITVKNFKFPNVKNPPILWHSYNLGSNVLPVLIIENCIQIYTFDFEKC